MHFNGIWVSVSIVNGVKSFKDPNLLVKTARKNLEKAEEMWRNIFGFHIKRIGWQGVDCAIFQTGNMIVIRGWVGKFIANSKYDVNDFFSLFLGSR